MAAETLPVRCLVLILLDGTRYPLGRGSTAELAFLRQSFVEAWDLADDPMSVAAYPSEPPWWSTVSRRIIPGGVIVWVRPPWVGWVGVAVLPVVLVAAAAVDSVTFAKGFRESPTVSAWGVARVAALGLLEWTFVVVGVRRLRWQATMTAVGRHVTVTERSPLCPGHADWPADQVVGVERKLTPSGRTADLILRLADGSTTPLWTRGPHRQAKFVCDTVSVAIALHPPPPTTAAATP